MRKLWVMVLMGAGLLAAAPGQAATLIFITKLDGASEAPPNTSPAFGRGRVDIDPVAAEMRVRFNFFDLEGPLTAAHIHGPTPGPFDGVAGVITTTPTFPATPVGATSGSYDRMFDLTDAGSFNPGFVASQGDVSGAAAALLASIVEGRAYLNLHSAVYPGGEIRGFLAPIPLPAGLWLIIAGAAALTALRRRAA